MWFCYYVSQFNGAFIIAPIQQTKCIVERDFCLSTSGAYSSQLYFAEQYDDKLVITFQTIHALEAVNLRGHGHIEISHLLWYYANGEQ